jgi:glycosyltransferase involved in cell wall biosynthesis
MKIAFLTPEYVTEPNFDGGLASYLYRVAAALRDTGHEPVIFVATDREAELMHEGISVIRVNVQSTTPFLIRAFRKSGYSRPLQWIWQSWKLNRALLLHHSRALFDIAQYTSYTATALFRPRAIPSVVRISSLQSLWDAASGNAPALHRKIAQYLEAAALKKADRIIGPGKTVARQVEKLTKKKVHLVESPYTQTSGQRDDRPYKALCEGKKYLLFFGSIGVLKGVTTIGDILHPLLAKHPDLYFVFVGKDMRYKGGAMMDYIRMQARTHSYRVIYPGVLPHDQLLPIIEHACAVVLPSRVDNFPNTCLEAMACGQIVIGTRGASFEQLIDDGANGFLCHVDDGQSLLQSIEAALSLPEEKKLLMAGKAQQRIALLGPEATVAALLGQYQQALACHAQQ